MGYDPRKAAWDRAARAPDAPPHVSARIEDEQCTLFANGVGLVVEPGLALEHGDRVWEVVRAMEGTRERFAGKHLWEGRPARRGGGRAQRRAAAVKAAGRPE